MLIDRKPHSHGERENESESSHPEVEKKRAKTKSHVRCQRSIRRKGKGERGPLRTEDESAL